MLVRYVADMRIHDLALLYSEPAKGNSALKGLTLQQMVNIVTTVLY
jgi:hypothetical protein